jgi:hypothetical protein
MEVIPDAFSNANKRAHSDQQTLIDECCCSDYFTANLSDYFAAV